MMRAIVLVACILTGCGANERHAGGSEPPSKQPVIQLVPPGGPPPTELPQPKFPDCSAGCVDVDGELVPKPKNAGRIPRPQ